MKKVLFYGIATMCACGILATGILGCPNPYISTYILVMCGLGFVASVAIAMDDDD